VRLSELVTRTLKLEDIEGTDKAIGLAEAVRKYIKPGMSIYVGEGANGILREIIRQFRGTKPNFTLVISGCRDSALDLIHSGLVSKLITSRAAEGYPSQGRSPIIKRAFQSGSLEIENWSLYTLALRLMAGAMGIGFMPTKSISGSSMAEENQDSFIQIENPFGGDKIGLVKALNPDISVVHGWAADRNGNIIMAPAILSGQVEWGPFASKNGVIATVEKLVSTKFIREHSLLVKIPSQFVNSVTVLPFGAHPQGLASLGKAEFEEYEADYEFMEKHWEASKDATTLDAWLKEWVMDCSSNEEYLGKLGYPRLAFLKGKAGGFNWEHKLLWLSEEILRSTRYNATEMMIIAASWIIKEKVLNNRYRVIVAGIGTGGLSAWLAYYELRKDDYDVELMIGSGLYGYAPRPGDPQLTNLSSLRTCKMITDVIHTYGVFVGGERSRCLSVLGAGQIDKYGNINSTILLDGSFLVGSGGSNDATAAKEVIVVAAQSTKHFVNKLPYITCSGGKVSTVVSDKGIFEKIDNSNELILTGYFANPGVSDQSDIVRTIRDDCGWELKVYSKLKKIKPPSLSELVLLRLLDPNVVKDQKEIKEKEESDAI